MTPRDVERLMRTWQRRLGLQLWELELVIDPARWDEQQGKVAHRDQPHASVWRARDYDTARLYLNPSEWRSWPPRELEQNVVHELLHLATREVEHVLDLLGDNLHRDVEDMLVDAHRHAVEGVVDRLAYRLVDLAPVLASTPAPRARARKRKRAGVVERGRRR